MYDNILMESIYVEKLYSEFINTVNRYKNLNRSSIFCRYLNINAEASNYDKEAMSTFDRYNSGIQYDIYDYTPLYYSSQVINETQDNPDLVGQMFQGTLSATIYSIEIPRIEDLIIFNRAPQTGLEIFRVDHIRASINAIQSNPNTHWFELTLEYAPIVDLSKLNYLNHYSYCLPMQKNIFFEDFKELIQDTTVLSKQFHEFQKLHFNKTYELYTYKTENGHEIAPLFENKIIYQFLATKNFYRDHFANIYRPFGIFKYGEIDCLHIDSEQIVFYSPDTKTFLNGFTKTIQEVENPINIYELCHLIRLWIWYQDREKYPLYKEPENSIYPQIESTDSCLTIANPKLEDGIKMTIDVSKLDINTFGD